MTVERWAVTPALRSVHTALAAVAERLPSEVWVVGGCVRDRLGGRPSTDLDVIVTAPPGDFAESLLAETRAHAPPGEAGASGLTCLDPDWPVYRVIAGEVTVDIVPRGDDLDAELRRRDLTINAMAVPFARWADEAALEPRDLIDPCGGAGDLSRGLVRATSRHALVADPVRILRVGRFAVASGLRVSDETAAWVRELSHLLRSAPGERVAHELMETFRAPGARACELLDDLGMLDVLFPELAALRGMEQGGFHHLDAREHSLAACSALADLILGGNAGITAWDEAIDGAAEHVRMVPLPGVRSRTAVALLAGLLHDIGKPASRSVDEDGRTRFKGHADTGAGMVGRIARRLKLTRAERSHLQALVRHHMRPCLLGAVEVPTARAVARLARALGEAAPDVCLVAMADRAAAAGPKVTPELVERQVSATAAVVRAWRQAAAAEATAVRLLTGHDVMAALGTGPGPEVGRILAEVETAWLAGEVATREEALELARNHASMVTQGPADEDPDDGL